MNSALQSLYFLWVTNHAQIKFRSLLLLYCCLLISHSYPLLTHNSLLIMHSIKTHLLASHMSYSGVNDIFNAEFVPCDWRFAHNTDKKTNKHSVSKLMNNLAPSIPHLPSMEPPKQLVYHTRNHKGMHIPLMQYRWRALIPSHKMLLLSIQQGQEWT